MDGKDVGGGVSRGARQVSRGARQFTRQARHAGDHPVIEWGARLGYLVNGLLHLVIGWLALRIAFGNSGASADQSGVFSTLGTSTLGRTLLVVMLVGFGLLAIWQVIEAIGIGDTGKRVKAAAKGVLYFALAFAVLGFLRGTGSSSSGQSVDFTARLMEAPAGRLLVGAVGLAVIAVGGYHVYKGIAKKFLEDLRDDPGRPAEVAGTVGYVAKGVALGLIGMLFCLAALRNDPGQANGLDGGLRQLLEFPFGRLLLVAVAAGFVLFAFYCAARARHAKV